MEIRQRTLPHTGVLVRKSHFGGECFPLRINYERQLVIVPILTIVLPPSNGPRQLIGLQHHVNRSGQ